MNSEEIRRIFEQQKANRWSVAGSGSAERIQKLKQLKKVILARRDELHQALHADYAKHPAEADLTEIYPAVTEINHTVRHLNRWMKPQKVKTPLTLLGTRGEIRHVPRGQVLILSPWNYPFNLTIAPLISAIAAGNCVVIKPSSKVPQTAKFLKSMLSEVFAESEVAVFEGDSSVSDALLELPFDHVFFTGSPRVGKKIMAAASRHLASVTLELGGKSPAIVDETADLRPAAERILWGKFINAGQTCVAPDYLLIHKSRIDEFVKIALEIISHRYGSTPEQRKGSPDFCRLVNESHVRELKKTVEASVQQGAKIVTGGQAITEERYFEPTLLADVTAASPIMKEEIFGPVLPILTFEHIEQAIELIQANEKPLALYLFTRDCAVREKVLHQTTSGGSCVNTLILHLGNPDLPFGGVGQSGMGNYHGHFGFRTFSHERAVLKQGRPDILRFFYPPYTPRIGRMLEWIIRWFA